MQYSIKYRPASLQQVKGQHALKRELIQRSMKSSWPKAMLMRGPYGTGKTTVAHIVAKNIQCQHKDKDGNSCDQCPSCLSIINETFDRDTMMLDGSQLGHKDSVVEFTSMTNVRAMYDKSRVFIVEEADQLSGAAINALLKVLETPSSNVHFILLSMEKGGLPPAIVSRCQVYDFKAIELSEIMMALKEILEKEQFWNESLPEEFKLQGLATIASLSKGSLRDAVQLLEQAVVGEHYSKEQIEQLVNSIDDVSAYKILEGLATYSTDEAMWRKIYSSDAMELYNYLTLVLSEVMLYKTTNVMLNEVHSHTTQKLAKTHAVEELFKILSTAPQISKPFLRKSDLLSMLSLFYLQKPTIPVRRPL